MQMTDHDTAEAEALAEGRWTKLCESNETEAYS
jgi:hypothetical protein